MEGPSFYCAYLGFSALQKPPTNLSVLQNTVKDLYFTYRKTPASGHSANLKLVQNGVLVVLYENGSVKTEMFFDYSSVTFVEAAKFAPVKTSSERKPKAMFVPVDESKGSMSDKHAFPVEKAFHFLISSTHPPLVICVVRRPTGVKALDCHVFALDTIENSLHISALIASAQMPAGHYNKVESIGDPPKAKGGFDRGVRGDVIRSDYGDYSVYRGPNGYEMPPSQQFSGGAVSEHQPGQWYGGGPVHSLGGPIHSPGGPIHSPGGPIHSPGGLIHSPGGHIHSPGGPVQSPGRNDHQRPQSGGTSGPMILTQDIFRDQPSPSQPYGGVPGPKEYGMYEQPNYGGAPGGGYYRQPDVIMHTRQMSGDGSGQPSQDQSYSGQDPASMDVRMRYEEVSMRNNVNSRLSGGGVHEARLSGGQASAGNRLSAGQGYPSGKISPRPHELPGYNAEPPYTQWQSGPMPSPASPMSNMSSPRSPHTYIPGSPQGFGAPIHSASNLESRSANPQPDTEEHISGRPVAKVPPHMIGVKVLPTDFRMVKLKPKADKRPESSDIDPYDNAKESPGMYKELYEPPPGKAKHFPDGNAFQDFDAVKGRHDEYSRDYGSHWNDTVKDNVSGDINKRYDNSSNVSRHESTGDYSSRYEDNNNKNRHSGPSYGGDRTWEQRPQANYEPRSNSPRNSDPNARTKDLEIANMFSNVRLQGGSNQPMYRQPRDRNEIEEGLGYLP
ncbi:unnamed protein product [Candidula unifasciata]|uniref:Uncharacterized protein n=1 Tax=Candidula unifasciata TaxID=100452 RepID=A0A8S3YZY1_9EUPU|nr:unnamed protein product [Candidula unifasciata]